MSLARAAAAFLGDPVANPRPQPMQRETFEVFLITGGVLSGAGNAIPLGSHDTLDAAIADGTRSHKSNFLVRHANMLTGAVMLKFYAVRQKSKGVRRYSDYETRTIRSIYAEHLFDLRGDAL